MLGRAPRNQTPSEVPSNLSRRVAEAPLKAGQVHLGSGSDIELLEELKGVNLTGFESHRLGNGIGDRPVDTHHLLTLKDLLLYIDLRSLGLVELGADIMQKGLDQFGEVYVVIFVAGKASVDAGDGGIDEDFLLRAEVAEQHVLRESLHFVRSRHHAIAGCLPQLHG